MSDRTASLRALFTGAGYAFVEPPIIHDASVFVEVAGEDLRRRMYLTANGDGRELALRPEYTIPVCLHHLSTGAAARRGSYAYLGPVFRQRSTGLGEFMQAGIESLGRDDAIAADADVLALALSAASALGVNGAQVTIGDSALFATLLDKLDLSGPWRRRLKRTFGDTVRLNALIAEALSGPRTPVASDDPAVLRDRIGEMFAATGLGVIGARDADEIAERFLDKQALTTGIGDGPGAILREFLAISGSPRRALAEIHALAALAGLALGPALDRFAMRLDAFAERGIDVGSLQFAADFGRRLDYYTGFVFELHRGDRSAQNTVIGGGRYDRLMSLIHHPEAPRRDVPAVGFAVSLDRVDAP